MADDCKVTEGHLAKNPDGSLAAMPRKLASEVDRGLMELLTLLRCAMDQIDLITGAADLDADRMSSADSRATLLLMMADRRTRELVRSISPYA